jgi:hypothetical protein
MCKDLFLVGESDKDPLGARQLNIQAGQVKQAPANISCVFCYFSHEKRSKNDGVTCRELSRG